jgi:hypothetical protein
MRSTSFPLWASCLPPGSSCRITGIHSPKPAEGVACPARRGAAVVVRARLHWENLKQRPQTLWKTRLCANVNPKQKLPVTH